MPNQQMDAQAGFAYLTEQLPVWVNEVNELSKYAGQKSEEFAAEYESMAKTGEITHGNGRRHKRMKSASMHSIQASITTSTSHREQEHDHQDSEVYSSVQGQGQRKRKRPFSIRSFRRTGSKSLSTSQKEQPKGAEEEEEQKKEQGKEQTERTQHSPIRRRNHVVRYDSHVQVQLDSMVRSIGIARNNLRKARNAYQAAQGFKLPTLKPKVGASAFASLDSPRSGHSSNSLHSNSKPSQQPTSSPSLALACSKSTVRTWEPTPNNEINLFSSTDKQLESVQGLYETAAYQFLREGRCQTELNSAKSRLDALVSGAQQSLRIFQEKAKAVETEKTTRETKTEKEKKQEKTETTPSADPHPLMRSSSLDPLQVVNNKFGPTKLSETLEDMKKQQQQQQQQQQQEKTAVAVAAPAKPHPVPSEGPAFINAVIEVNDNDSDSDESFADIDVSRFRAANTARLARAF